MIPNMLFSINIKISKEELVAIVGAVGSGKSSIISTLIGEIEKIEGRVNVSVRISWKLLINQKILTYFNLELSRTP